MLHCIIYRYFLLFCQGFEIVQAERMHQSCIQFTDKTDGVKYALKVINGTNTVVFEVSETTQTIVN